MCNTQIFQINKLWVPLEIKKTLWTLIVGTVVIVKTSKSRKSNEPQTYLIGNVNHQVVITLLTIAVLH